MDMTLSLFGAPEVNGTPAVDAAWGKTALAAVFHNKRTVLGTLDEAQRTLLVAALWLYAGHRAAALALKNTAAVAPAALLGHCNVKDDLNAGIGLIKRYCVDLTLIPPQVQTALSLETQAS